MSLLSSDRELLKRFRLGKQEALARVYREYAPAIAAFLARGFSFSSKGRTLQFNGYHQPFDIENAVQETFVRAFSERARLAYDGLSPYKSYIMAVARNLVLSELRRREVAMSQLVKVVDDGAADAAVEKLARGEAESPVAGAPPSLNGEVEFLHQELKRLYGAFVDELKPEHREFFVARFEQRLTQVEAGKRAGLSHMQARTLEKKLRKRFLSFMQSRGYLEGYTGSYAVATLCLMLMM
jgi:RNA polymerase sigma-70 factor (ECF subfamily)